ncbi:GNAT family N-acetyltransferase [Aquimarina hainanensis]|uniref:GNAT family N-acetyltransferase n=1 Tax=Aquimarina hainanensis TaxID=1578017 RepID=A0ABW5NCR9_9FLAO|nr:GNAT family N-acetyltransferase [Aquimarina sp. TRL1]QKX06385.1 acetyltransferase [Aquimarina sp. TRL1]
MIQRTQLPNKSNESTVYSIFIENFGHVSLKHFDIKRDASILHTWVNEPYAFFWGMQGSSLEEVKKEYIELLKPDHYDIFTGYHNDQPAFFLERYTPSKDIISNYYDAKNSDCGVHIIVAPPVQNKIPGFTLHLFQTIMDFVFTNTTIDRILVEPDIRNKKMFTLCERIGFVTDKTVELPHKTAQLAFLDKNRYQQQKTHKLSIHKQ